MSAAPISAAEEAVPDGVRAALARAGWPVAAWTWEQAVLAALQALADGDDARARAGFAAAQGVAEGAFPADDLRRVTAAANLALLDADEATAAALARRWAAGEAWVTGLRPRSGARSATFHLRLQAKHPGGYDRLGAERLRRRWADAARALAAVPDNAADGPGHARMTVERWMSVQTRLGFDGERKIAAAAGLLLAR